MIKRLLFFNIRGDDLIAMDYSVQPFKRALHILPLKAGCADG